MPLPQSIVIQVRLRLVKVHQCISMKKRVNYPEIKHHALHRYVNFLLNLDKIWPQLYTKRLYTVAYKFCVKL